MKDVTATVEALLAAKLHLAPQTAGDLIYFLSDLSGRLSLYSMPKGGGAKTRLIPDDVALPNPKLLVFDVLMVLPDLEKILLLIDRDGDEHYQPHFVPIGGGTPQPIWPGRFAGEQVSVAADRHALKALLWVSPRSEPEYRTYLADLRTLEVTHLGSSVYGNYPAGHDADYTRIALIDGYAAADNVLFLWEAGVGERRMLAGTPLEDRGDTAVPLTAYAEAHIRDEGVLVRTALFDDAGGVCLIPLEGGEPRAAPISGTTHRGAGELTGLHHISADLYELHYNIDGVSHAYVATLDAAAPAMRVEKELWGSNALADGVVEASSHDLDTGDWSVAFSSATSPVQLYSVGSDRVSRHTTEEIVGIESASLASGEDASYVSHDGTRVSARLYLPAQAAGGEPHPVIYYVHGGPQSQERPDFTWFSMPLIQLFTLSGFAVFVPNARGSTGYGLSYMKLVDKDWGGQDRLDHVAGVASLRPDDRLDLARLGVMGRSYGGFMTLTLLGRHPDLWRAGVDMFGPYDLFTFTEALPETWKTYMYLAMGHPERDRDLLVDRSPRTHLDALAAPLLVIQGRNDPRVVVGESDALVADLRAKGKDVEYLVFDDEGHDMVKHASKVEAYVAIVEFFQRKLGVG